MDGKRFWVPSGDFFVLFSKAEAHVLFFVCRALAAAVSLAHNRREIFLMVLRDGTRTRKRERA